MEVDVVITAVADEKDSHFEGRLTISNTTFSYDVELVVPIERYNQELQGKTTDEMRRAIVIRVWKEEVELNLENDEYRLFYYFLMRQIIEIHNSRVLLRRRGMKFSEAVTTGGGQVGLKPEACYILARPKFGCRLISETVEKDRKPN